MKCKYLFASLLILASCTKEVSVKMELPDLPSEAVKTSVLRYQIRLECGTKGSGYTDVLPYESILNNMQVFIFDSDTETLNYYDEFTTTAQGGLNPDDLFEEVELYYGEKTFYAIANGPSLKDIATLSELKALTYGMKENNTESGMIMVAMEEFTLDENGSEIYPKLNRMACRFHLSRIVNELPPAYSQIQIKKVFLGNVSSKIGYFGASVSPSVSPYINPAGVIDTPVYSMTCKDVDMTATRGQSCVVDKLLYCYLNPLDFSSTGTFISVLAEVGGDNYYYTIYLDPLDQKMNYTSDITLHIVGLGTDDPSIAVVKATAGYEIEVKEWAFASSYIERI